MITAMLGRKDPAIGSRGWKLARGGGEEELEANSGKYSATLGMKGEKGAAGTARTGVEMAAEARNRWRSDIVGGRAELELQEYKAIAESSKAAI